MATWSGVYWMQQLIMLSLWIFLLKVIYELIRMLATEWAEIKNPAPAKRPENFPEVRDEARSRTATRTFRPQVPQTSYIRNASGWPGRSMPVRQLCRRQ